MTYPGERIQIDVKYAASMHASNGKRNTAVPIYGNRRIQQEAVFRGLQRQQQLFLIDIRMECGTVFRI